MKRIGRLFKLAAPLGLLFLASMVAQARTSLRLLPAMSSSR